LSKRREERWGFTTGDRARKECAVNSGQGENKREIKTTMRIQKENLEFSTRDIRGVAKTCMRGVCKMSR